jgi:hypothetical protein
MSKLNTLTYIITVALPILVGLICTWIIGPLPDWYFWVLLSGLVVLMLTLIYDLFKGGGHGRN